MARANATTTTGATPAEGDGARLRDIYLNDHLAGPTGGVELARRAAGGHEGTDLGAFLSRLAV